MVLSAPGQMTLQRINDPPGSGSKRFGELWLLSPAPQEARISRSGGKNRQIFCRAAVVLCPANLLSGNTLTQDEVAA